MALGVVGCTPSPDQVVLPEDDGVNAAVIAMQEKRYEHVAGILEFLLKENPPQPAVQYICGSAAYELGRYGEADERMTDACTRDPQFWKVSSAMGFARFKLGDYAGAQEAFKKITEADDGAYKAHYGQGLVALEEGRYGDARGSLARSIALSPGYIKARFAMARLMEEEGGLAQAREEFAWVIGQSPSHVEAYYHLGQVLHRMGKEGQAQEVMAQRTKVYQLIEKIGQADKRIREGEDIPTLWLEVVYGYLELNDLRFAQDAVLQGVGRHPEDGALRVLAEKLLKGGV